MEALGPQADLPSYPRMDAILLFLPRREIYLFSFLQRSNLTVSKLTLKLDLHMVAGWLIPSPVGKRNNIDEVFFKKYFKNC